MGYTIVFSLLLSVIFAPVQADDNFCRKCQVLREYHEQNPSKYTYYDDYLKDLSEKGEQAVNPQFKDLPKDVQYIVDPAQASKEKSR